MFRWRAGKWVVPWTPPAEEFCSCPLVILHIERQGFMTPISFSKALPIPNEDRIKHLLGQNAWTSQKNELACFYPRLASKSETGKIGLINLGNTCYMNSIIQSLFMASEWVFAPLLPFKTALGLLITQALCFPCWFSILFCLSGFLLQLSAFGVEFNWGQLPAPDDKAPVALCVFGAQSGNYFMF